MQLRNIEVSLTDRQGRPIPDLDVAAISLTRTGQIDEVEQVATTDDAGVVTFHLDEPCYYRPMLSPMLKREIRIVAINVGGQGIKKHAIVDAEGFGTHTTIQAAIDALETLHEADGSNNFCVHVNPGFYAEVLNFGLIATSYNIVLEGQGSVSSLADAEYNPVVRIKSDVTDPLLTIENAARVTLRGLWIEQDKAAGGYDAIGIKDGNSAVFINDCYVDGSYGAALTVLTSTAPDVDVNNTILTANNATGVATIGNGLTVGMRFHNCYLRGLPILEGDWANIAFVHCRLSGNNQFGSGYLIQEDNLVISGSLTIDDCDVGIGSRAAGFVYFGNASGNTSTGLLLTGNRVTGGTDAKGVYLEHVEGAVIGDNHFKGFNGTGIGVEFADTVHGVSCVGNLFEDCETGIKNTDTALDVKSVIGPNTFFGCTTDMDGIPDVNNYQVSVDDLFGEDAGDLSYTPAVVADWDGGADPGDADDALDQLAERTKDLEDAAKGIDMHPSGTKLWTVDESGDDWGHDGPFTGQVNGNPTSTSVPYDTEVDEDSICTYMVLHNTTKGEKVKITGVNVGANTIAVEANSPDDADTWDDNDVLTTASQTNTGRTNGFVDIEVTDFLNSGSAAGFFFQDTLGSNNADDTLTLIVHPYEAYAQAKECHNLKAAGLPAFSYTAGFGMVGVVWEGGRAYFTLGVFWEADQLSGLLTFLAEF